MSIHILSVLGTTLYEPVLYQGKKSSMETEFIQMAVINEYKEELKNGGKVTIFVTDKSRELNYEDRIYTSQNQAFASRWISAKRADVIEGTQKKGFKTMIEEQFPDIAERVECVKLPDMKTEDEIWEVFDTIYSCIDEQDELVFDITHSFRSIPMLAVTVINYAKVLKKCKLKGVYYGAYEGAQDDGTIKTAPIIDLTVFNEILEWTYAAESFVNYGNIDKMKEVYNIRNDKIPNEEKRYWAPIRTMIQNMENVSLGISTCRGVDSTKLNSDKNLKARSVKQAYVSLKESITRQEPDLGKEITPMMELINHAAKQFEAFDCEMDYEVGIEMVRWSIRYHMIQQGYTALEETIKTFICEMYGIDDVLRNNREGIVSSMFTACEDSIPDDREILFERLTKEDKYFAPTYASLDDDMKEVARKMIMEIPKELFALAQGVKKYRNDINHLGFNDEARTSNVLENKLEEFFEKFENIVEDMKNLCKC